MDKSTALNSELSVVSRRALQATSLLWLIIAIVFYQSNLSISSAVMLAISIALAVLPVVLVSELNLIDALGRRRFSRISDELDESPDADTLSQITSVIFDQSELTDSKDLSASEFIIGRQIYQVSDTGSGQYGQIKNHHGHNLTATESDDIKLFLETCHATSSLTAKSDFNHDFTNPDYEVIRDSVNERVVIKRAGHQTVAFVRTSSDRATNLSREVWDHGHIRPFKPADREHYIEYERTQADVARLTVALAYAVLPAKFNIKDLTLKNIAGDLIFIGLMSFDIPVLAGVTKDIKLTTKSDLVVSMLSGFPASLAKSLAVKAGLNRSLKIITQTGLSGLSDDHILELLKKGVVFSDLSVAGRKRIIKIAKTDVRNIIYSPPTWTGLVSAIQTSRNFHLNVKKVLRCFLTTATSLVILIIAGGFSLATYHIGPAIVPIQVALVSLLILPLPVLALVYDKPAVKHIKEAWRDRLSDSRAAFDFIGFGLLAAMISYANFLLFFDRNDISPSYIATDTPLYLQATSVTWITLIVCLAIHLFFERQNTHDSILNDHTFANRRLLAYCGLSFLLTMAVVYIPALAEICQNYPIKLSDWLMVLAGSSLFFIIRLSQRQTRQHSREVVLKLHSQVHKS